MQQYAAFSWINLCEPEAGLVGLSALQIACTLAIFNGVLFVFTFLHWLYANKYYNRSEFSSGVWKGWIYIVAGFSILQNAIWLSRPLIGYPVCPYDYLGLYSAVPVAIAFLYGYHLSTGKSGRFSKFIVLIALPIVCEVSGINYVKTGATVLKNGWEFFGYAFEHVAPLLRL